MSAVPSLRANIKAGELEVSQVSKSYGDATFRTEVVRNCSFKIERSKLTVMIGPSGCGKSTLIRMLAGFERPDGGTITLNDAPVTGPARDRLVLFQESALFPWMTTWDNILYGPRARGEMGRETLEMAEFLLNKGGDATTPIQKQIPRFARDDRGRVHEDTQPYFQACPAEHNAPRCLIRPWF